MSELSQRLSEIWSPGEIEPVSLEAIDERLSRYRLRLAADEASMLQSLKHFGQISPVVVTMHEERTVLIDGFKRLRGARQLRGMRTLLARRVELDERRAKAAVFLLNQTGRRTDLWEESWIVQALVREDRLSQVEVGELLGRHKSWVCRRLALLEQLADPAKDDLRVGLLSPSFARQLIRLPRGNQVRALGAVRDHSLSEAETRGVVELLLSAGSREKENYVLEKPREALREAQGAECRSWDPRLSASGNRVSRHLASLLDGLDRMQNWLRHRGRSELRLCDRDVLRDGFHKLTAQTRSVGELTEDFLKELHLP
jgi:ParB-like chromosome segregation protein Spo0J